MVGHGVSQILYFDSILPEEMIVAICVPVDQKKLQKIIYPYPVLHKTNAVKGPLRNAVTSLTTQDLIQKNHSKNGCFVWGGIESNQGPTTIR